MPRAPRGPGSGQPRPHSRSSSATRMGANLQFTLKEPQPPKHTDKTKKAPCLHEPHPTKPAPPFVRTNSSQRVHSREHLAKRLAPLHHQQHQPRPKNAKGFTIASPSENADDDDDDDEGDWVSSESGAATPNQQDSDSETASEVDDPSPALLNLQIPPQARVPTAAPPPTHQVGFLAKHDSSLARVDTARPSDFEHPPRTERKTPRPPTPPKQYHQPQVQPPLPQPLYSLMERRSTTEPENIREPPIHARQSPRPKRNSRPPSVHSIQSRNEHPLRPHPLIRGMSHGHVIPVPKPSPLAPLTVLPVESDLPQVSSSPSSLNDSVKNYLSSSPTSVKTSSGSPVSADLSHSARYPSSHDRRTSFSSARSVNTIPVQTTMIKEAPWTHDRTRTLSTMSSSSLSAALSSLTHIPSVTRPPSPQSIVFFPPVNPHANVEAIHPLLPVPYLQNHLTVLSRRTPIRESFDRVMHAKNTR